MLKKESFIDHNYNIILTFSYLEHSFMEDSQDLYPGRIGLIVERPLDEKAS